MPPLAVIELEYAAPTVPDASVVPTVNAVGVGAATTIDSLTDCVCAGLPASVTVAVKLLVPVAVGVPEISPVVEDRLSPAGRLPAEIDHA